MSIEINIDGKTCTCEPGEYLAEIALRNGIDIPLLCGKNDALSGRGCCRVCMVEVTESGRSKVVASCIYPVAKSCEVATSNERIIKERGIVFALLRSLAPDSKLIADMAKQYNAFSGEGLDPLEEGGTCILCGLCVEACKALGAGAISTVGRGIDKMVATPFDEPSPVCIGCGSCVQACPTKHISMTTQNGVRTIWNREFPMGHCDICGAEIDATDASLVYGAKRIVEMGALDNAGEEVVTGAAPGVEDLPALCSLCKKAQMSEAFIAESVPEELE